MAQKMCCKTEGMEYKRADVGDFSAISLPTTMETSKGVVLTTPPPIRNLVVSIRRFSSLHCDDWFSCWKIRRNKMDETNAYSGTGPVSSSKTSQWSWRRYNIHRPGSYFHHRKEQIASVHSDDHQNPGGNLIAFYRANTKGCSSSGQHSSFFLQQQFPSFVEISAQSIRQFLREIFFVWN